MSREPRWLLDHCSDTFSQKGEDGVIGKILSLLPETDRWCVEFGAWDGVRFSNTRKLVLEQKYRAVMIEGDTEKFEALKRNYAGNDDVHAVNALVGFGANDGLDTILSEFAIPGDFDFLSIDIDGNDYYAWEAIEQYRPKVVCVEFNPTIPTEVNFVQIADPRVNQGCSLLALYELARAKGYQAVCVLPFNVVFVDEQYFARFEIPDNSPQALRGELSHLTSIFFGYDGSVHLAGAKRMPWHGIYMDERDVQLLPRILRRHPANYTPLQKKLFRLLKRFRSWRSGR